MLDTIVVGGGIIGSTVAEVLRRKNLDVLLIDDGRAGSGTAPSGGHLKESWFGGMPRSEYMPALELLDQTWGLHSEEFRLLPDRGVEMIHRVNTDQVLKSQRLEATVTGLRCLDNYPIVSYGGGEERCRLLVVSAGCWIGALVESAPRVVAKQGVSFRLGGELNDGPFVQPWAPYKQIVAHQQSPGEVWVGDGTAVLPGNWKETRTLECRRRCLGAVGLPSTSVRRTLTGLRPYASPMRSGEPCRLWRPGPRVWAATGSGKLGTIAAGWAAGKIVAGLK